MVVGRRPVECDSQAAQQLVLQRQLAAVQAGQGQAGTAAGCPSQPAQHCSRQLAPDALPAEQGSSSSPFALHVLTVCEVLRLQAGSQGQKPRSSFRRVAASQLKLAATKGSKYACKALVLGSQRPCRHHTLQ